MGHPGHCRLPVAEKKRRKTRQLALAVYVPRLSFAELTRDWLILGWFVLRGAALKKVHTSIYVFGSPPFQPQPSLPLAHRFGANTHQFIQYLFLSFAESLRLSSPVVQPDIYIAHSSALAPSVAAVLGATDHQPSLVSELAAPFSSLNTPFSDIVPSLRVSPIFKGKKSSIAAPVLGLSQGTSVATNSSSESPSSAAALISDPLCLKSASPRLKSITPNATIPIASTTHLNPTTASSKKTTAKNTATKTATTKNSNTKTATPKNTATKNTSNKKSALAAAQKITACSSPKQQTSGMTAVNAAPGTPSSSDWLAAEAAEDWILVGSKKATAKADKERVNRRQAMQS